MTGMTGTTGPPGASRLSLSETEAHVELNEAYGAHNYHPLRVVLSAGEGAWVTDVEGLGTPIAWPVTALSTSATRPPPRGSSAGAVGPSDAHLEGVLQRQLGPFAATSHSCAVRRSCSR